MDTTMNRIHQLSDERHQLWLKAGHGELTDQEYWRLQQITRELVNLWDDYRRQRAAVARSGNRREEEVRYPDGASLARAA